MLSHDNSALDLLRWSFLVGFGGGFGWSLGVWLFGAIRAAIASATSRA